MTFTADKLKQARDAGYSDDEIWGFAAQQDDRFNKAKDAGYSLDEVSGFLTQKEKQPEGVPVMAPDPIRDYNSSVAMVQSLTKSRDENYGRYQELSQLPERTPEAISEMVKSFEVGKQAELNLFKEQETMAKLQAQVAEQEQMQKVEEVKRAREQAAAQVPVVEPIVEDVGQLEGIKNAAMNAFDASRQAMAVSGGVTPEEAETISKLEYQKEARKLSPAYSEYLQAEGMDAVKAFAKNPFEITTNIVAEGLAGSLYSLGAGVAAGGVAAAATAATGVGAPLAPAAFLGGQIGGTFAGSLATEYGSKVLEELQNAGMDLRDPESIKKFFSDEKLTEDAKNKSLKRGVPVAIFDGVSAGIGGRLARLPVQALTKTPTRLAVTEAVTQAALGGGGEIAGAVAAGERVQPKAVFAEVLGEAGPATAEITVGRIAERLARTPEQKQFDQNVLATQVATRASQDIAPATADAVERQVQDTLASAAETPDERVARIQREAQESAGEIELEEEVAGLPPVEPTPPVTPTPEVAVAPVEPVAPAEGAVEPAVTEVAPETVQAAEQKATEDFAQDLYGQEPYINHLRRVSEQMPNNKLKTAAFIHDSVEDGKMTLDEVRSQFGDDVAGLVDVVSRKEGETYAQFIDRVAQNPEAAQIKLADLRENIRNVEDFKPSLRSRYEKAIAVLEPVVAQVAPTPEAAPAAAEPTQITEAAPPITATRTVADAIRDKDTFVYNGQRGAVSVEDGVTVFRPFGTQEKFEIGINPNQTIGEIEGIEWARKGQVRTTPVEPKPENSSIIESKPTITTDEIDQAEPDFEVPVSLIEIEKSKTLNDLADLFDTGDSKVVQDGKRARKVSETPEFYRQVTPQQIDLAKQLIDNALRIIDALPISDQQKQDMAEPFLLLDQDINNYENNPEYQRYKATIRTEVRPAGEAGAFPTTETEVAAWIKESEQRAAAEARRLGRAPEVVPAPEKPVTEFATIEELYRAFDAKGAGHARFRTRLDSMVNEEALTSDARDMILATLWDNNVNDEFLMNIEVGSLSAMATRTYGRGGFGRQQVAGPTGPMVGYKPSLKLFRNTRKEYPNIDERSAQILSTFWHEYGHVGYYALLDRKQKDVVNIEFAKTTKAQRQKFFEEGVAGTRQTEWFRKYYAKNQSEWFAQSFAEYILTKKSDNKKLVPVFENILDKIKNVFNKLFNRTETVNLEDIFEFILRGEAYGTKPVWYGGDAFTMAREPSIYTGGPQIIRGAREVAPPTVASIWQAPEQEITSQETSINERKIPAIFNQVKEWVEGTVNADIGGGRFDNVTNWLRERGVTNLIIDWFNRDRAFNEANIERVRGGQADTATVSNVLNVIQEADARDLVIRQAADAIKEDGAAYFYIYEGNGSGQGRATTKGWQENRKASTYVDEISRHFGSVERRNQMIIARNPIKETGVESSMEAPPKVPTFTAESPEAATLKEMEASMAKVDSASKAKGGKPETYKISEIASVWMDSGLGERELQDAIVEYTNLTPANAARVAKAIARQYDIQQSIATAFLETQTGLSVEALPEGVALPKEVDPDRPKPVMQRLFEVFMGVRVPPTKITVNEKTALKQQIRLKAAANRAAKAAQKETSDQVIEVIKAMDLRGGVRPKQVQALAKRAAKVIWTNEKSLETFADYAAKVVENANYDADLREAKAAQARAKQLSKQKKIAAPQREMLDNISKIAVNRLDDPRMYADVVNYYLRGFKAVLSPDYVVVPDSEMTSYLSQMQSEATRNQRDLDRAVNERLAEKYGVDIDDLNSVLEAADIISQLEANENREAMDNLLTEKAIETRDGLKAYDQTPLRADQRKLVDAIMKVDPKALDAEERQRFIRITNNIIYNNQTNGAEYFASVAKGQQSAREAAQDSDMIAKNKAWINLLPRLVSERMQRGWALELQSVADTFRNAFGKGAMAKVYKSMGMLDLNMGFTKANNTIDEIQEKIAEFHTNLEKKYKAAARNQDGLLAEGVAGFLIQKVPNKGETESIAQRRDLISQDIANRRRSGEVDRMAMADRIETILNQIDGEGVQAILNNLKQVYPANHESLVWYKDTLLPQYKDFLKNFDENFNDQANNYDNPDYLPIAFSKASPSLAITKEEEQVFYDQVSLTPKQSAYTIKRLDYTKLPDDRSTNRPKEISFNLRRNAFDSLSDQINKAYTSAAWQQLASFMKTPESEVVFGGQANKDFFIERLNRLRLSRMRRGAMSSGNIERAVDALSVISRKLGTGIALGGFYQWIKQPPDQIVTALGSGGRYDLMAQNIMPKNQKAARELLRKFSIGRRGDASAGYKYINQMEGHQNRLERYFSESKWDQVKEEGGKIADVWMAALKQSDFWAASTAWMTYYEGELNKRNIKIEDWAKEAELVDTDPARQEAAAFAEQMTDIYQGSSDPTQMATFAQSGKSGWENLMKAIFVPFNSFAIQQRMRLYSDARDVLNGEKSGVGGLSGTIGGLLLFHATKRLVLPVISGGVAGILYSLLGVDMEEPDEEKQKEEANKRWRQMQGEMLGNLLVGGTPQIVEAKFIDAMNYASYLIALQLESEDILNDEGEVMSFDQYAKERSPFWRYRSFDNAMSLGMLDIGLGQAEQAILQTKMVATPEEMEMYTPEEQRLLYFSTLSEWMYLMRLNDADFARIVSKARRDMMAAAKEREKELKRIREGR